MIRIGRKALWCLPDPERDAKLDRIEEVLERFADRVLGSRRSPRPE